MGVTREVLTQGNGVDKPKKGDEVTIEYTGNLCDESKKDKKRTQYVSDPTLLAAFKPHAAHPS